MQVIQERETTDCIIVFLEDAVGEQWILKQIKDPTPQEQFLLVIDATTCAIGCALSIPVNKIVLISPGTPFPGRRFMDLPASFHALAAGKSVEEKLPWTSFDLHQRLRKEGSPQWKKWGPLPPEETGLSPAVLQTMAGHSSLPAIAALDTFTGNADRSNPNIFYNEETDTFCGIDMAAPFNSLLAASACNQLQRVLRKEITLTSSEILALGRYLLTFSLSWNIFRQKKLAGF